MRQLRSMIPARRCVRRTLLALGALMLSSASHPAQGATNSSSTTGEDAIAASLGRGVEDFQLGDFRGATHRLADLKDRKLVVLVFFGTECPLAKLYGPRLAELAAEYEPRGVGIWGLDANRQDSLAEMAAFARDHGLKFPLLKDAGNQVADRLGASRTPQAFVLDEGRLVRYAGRIDDQYGFEAGTSYQRPKATRRDLAEALDELLAGKPVSQPATPTPGCLIGRQRAVKENAAVTYSNQIARILNQRCVECHRSGQIGPLALTSYDEVVGWSEMIAEVVREGRMPPWHADPRYGHFANDARLSDEEQEQIRQWVEAGAPQGDPSQLPEPPRFVEGWQMREQPDVVIAMRDEPYPVPAEGVVEYQYFSVDTGFTEDKWIKTAECLPDNRSVVHHMIVLVKRPNAAPGPEGRGGLDFLVGFAPGTRPMDYGDNMAKMIPAGSKLIFQMHYTPNGTPQQDLSKVGLVFVDDPSKIKYLVKTDKAINTFFEIPPQADNHEVFAVRKFHKPTILLAMFPHMHLRGKSFNYELIYPDGTSEILLDVPRYDFNWQNHFILSHPKRIPAGSKMKCVAHFDNSTENLANPDPNSAVRWGDQTWEEMMIGWFDVAAPQDESPDEEQPGDRDEAQPQKKPQSEPSADAAQ